MPTTQIRRRGRDAFFFLNISPRTYWLFQGKIEVKMIVRVFFCFLFFSKQLSEQTIEMPVDNKVIIEVIITLSNAMVIVILQLNTV